MVSYNRFKRVAFSSSKHPPPPPMCDKNALPKHIPLSGNDTKFGQKMLCPPPPPPPPPPNGNGPGRLCLKQRTSHKRRRRTGGIRWQGIYFQHSQVPKLLSESCGGWKKKKVLKNKDNLHFWGHNLSSFIRIYMYNVSWFDTICPRL